MTVARDFEEFFASCSKYGVEYLVVGGYAFALHAHPRYTGYLDIFVRAGEDNAQRIMAALSDFGFTPPSLTWQDLSTTGRVFQLAGFLSYEARSSQKKKGPPVRAWAKMKAA